MIPKIDCCVEAVRRGVLQTNIIDGRIPHSILMELFTDEGFGTMFHGWFFVFFPPYFVLCSSQYIHTASPHTPCLTKKILKNQDFALFSAKLRFVRFAVNTYSIVLHALPNEKNFTKSRFCAFLRYTVFWTACVKRQLHFSDFVYICLLYTSPSPRDCS